MKEDEASKAQQAKGQAQSFADTAGGPIKLFWALLMTLIAVHLCNPLIFPDFFWDLGVGNWILGEGELPRSNVFTSAAFAQPWVCLSWGFSLLLSLVELYAGELGLIVLKFLLILFNIFSLDFLLKEIQKLGSALAAPDAHFSRYLVVSLVSVGLLFDSALSSSLVTFLSLQLILGLFLRMRRMAWSWPTFLGLFALAIVFSNTGSGVFLAFVVTLILVGVFVAPSRLGKRASSSSIIFSALLGISTFFTPYGAKLVIAAIGQAQFFVRNHLFESRSLIELASYPLGIVILFFVFAETLCLQNKQQPMLLWLVRIFSVLAVPFAAFTPVALLFNAVFVSFVLVDSSFASGEAREGIVRLRGLLQRLPYVGMTFVVFAAAFAGGVSLLRMPSVGFHLPHKALDAVLDVDRRFQIYHPREFGGFFVYRLSRLPGRLALHAHATEYLEGENLEVSNDFAPFSSVLLRGNDSRVDMLEKDDTWLEVGREDDSKLSERLSWRAFVRRSAL